MVHMLRNVLMLVSLQLIFYSSLIHAQDLPGIIEYLYPIPGCDYISPEATIIIRIKNENTLSVNDFSITVQGNEYFAYPGRILLSDNNEVCIFKPDLPFREGDSITANIKYNDLLGSNGYDFSFHIKGQFVKSEIKSEADDPGLHCKSTDNIELTVNQEIPGDQPVVLNGVSVPSDFPFIEVSVSKQPSPGYMFLSSKEDSRYLLILMNDGTPYFYRRAGILARDFKVHESGVLSWCDYITSPIFITMDEKYNIIDTLRAGHGYRTDDHDVKILSNGHFLIIAKEFYDFDMSQLIEGGKADAVVIGTMLQELDANQNVIFEFRAWDHFNIQDALHEDLAASSIDLSHTNSVDLDYDGHYLISNRNLDEVTKIHRHTGKIIWRLGGKNNEFDFINDSIRFTYQHDFRPVPGSPGHYTLFDNGTFHARRCSRAVEYYLDTTTMTATRVWEYEPNPCILTHIMGNTQRLTNGNTQINWSIHKYPKITEVTPEGEVVFEADFVSPTDCYRAYRFEWDNIMDRPYLISEPFYDRVRLIFNQFGDDDVDYYTIYTGEDPESFTILDSTSNTWIDLFDLEDEKTCFFKVTSVDHSGSESSFSETEEVLVNFAAPGENMIINGDFVSGKQHWDLTSSWDAESSGSVRDNLFIVEIIRTGDNIKDIKLIQNNLSLIEGREYALSFEAWADSSRIIDTNIEKAKLPFTDYGEFGSTYITSKKKRYQFTFTMKNKTDTRARFSLHAGGDPHHVYIDNVVLKELVNSNHQFNSNKDPKKLACTPNPTPDRLNINYHQPFSGNCNIQIINISGQPVAAIEYPILEAGNQNLSADLTGCQPGIYILKLIVSSPDGKINNQYHQKIIKQ